ncbi:hypothetical protein B0A48_10469 [Cryoendolithus antarcticus]|uniref:SH3 domain-containing protein n=1 Tax=Cryoendolithus antarcticus TaxID=1507870 RepID=A0A1V8SXX8_9PEZI|nr:hypothetical protein B0A48_10469 [Cryoendolithus antarcticus]
MPLINNPLPSSMRSECKKCGRILASFIDPKQSFGPDKVIPASVLANAKGLCVLTVFKAGFLGSGRFGSGVVVARLGDGSWSAPSAIGTAGAGFGGQIGFELTDFVFILNDANAVKTFAQVGSLTLGGNVSIAAGPVGRNAEAAGAASLKGVSGIFAYSKTKGLFAGVSLEGSVLIERRDANEKMYGRRVTARACLMGEVPVPPTAEPLMRVLNTRAFAGRGGTMGGDDAMYNDVPVYDDRNDDVVWQGQTGSPYGEGVRTDRTGTGSMSGTPTGGNFGSGAFGRGNDDDYVYSDKPQRASTFGSGRADPNSTFDRLENQRERSNTHNSMYSNSTFGGTGKIAPGRPSAPKPTFSFKTGSAGPGQAIAKFTFDADQPGDLGFKKGEVITIVKRTENEADWWTGRIGEREGIFPSNYVETVIPERPLSWQIARRQSTWTWNTQCLASTSKALQYRHHRAISYSTRDLQIKQTIPLKADQTSPGLDEPPEVEQELLSPQQMAQLKYLHAVLGLVESRTPASGSHPYFVAIDCEAYEHDQAKITEIGVSVLDVKHTRSKSAGSDGSAWYPAIQHLHLRPIEYRHLVNRNFIKGCPDEFNYGESTFIPLNDVGRILSRIFASPGDLYSASDLTISIPAAAAPDSILVGHALGNDTKYLSSLGCSLNNIVARIDTQKICGVGKHSQPGLAKLLRALGIEAKGLHNAGNDAAFTMMAMLSVAVREYHEAGSVAKSLAEAKASDPTKRKPRNWQEVRARDRLNSLPIQAVVPPPPPPKNEIAQPAPSVELPNPQSQTVQARLARRSITLASGPPPGPHVPLSVHPGPRQGNYIKTHLNKASEMENRTRRRRRKQEFRRASGEGAG